MRYLNKIVFINSAHIPYAEIMLDGNVHLIGTQGVGKSTLLRALLFFYNADKQHLGIQAGQRSFDEFYFQYANSYIVYEVMRDEGAFSILLSRYQGRATYRFIDAPYQKSWLVTDNGDVQTDWIRIRENITRDHQVDISARIDTYETYRDIIFGNTHERSHKYDKYAIIESQKYQNIPRSIQNVFLNSKLDAAFVKDTIIQSMVEEDVAIELSVYRKLVENFEREYSEISLWFKKEKNGEILIRRYADAVVTAYRESIALMQQLRSVLHQLNYAVEDAQQQLPVLRENLQQTESKITDLRQKRQETDNEYQTQQRLLAEKIGVKKDKLREISEKKKHYQEIDIHAILQLHEREPQLQNEKRQHEELLAKLTKQYNDIEEKYANLIKTIELQHQEFQNTQNTILNRKRNELQQQRDVLYKEHTAQIDEQNDRINASRDEIDRRIEQKHNELTHAEKKLQEIRLSQPYKTDIDACQEDIHQLHIQEKEANAKRKEIEAKIEQLRAEAQKEWVEQENLLEQRRQTLLQQKDKAENELSHIDSLLAQWKGSLYEWLTKNKPDWELTIGKVANEETILYAPARNPQITDEARSLYGVHIDLSDTPTIHRSPDEYRHIKKETEEQLNSIRHQLQDLQQEAETSQQKLNERLATKINPLRDEQTQYRVLAEQIPLKLKDKHTELDSLLRKAKEEKEQAAQKQQEVVNALILDNSKLKQEKEQLQAKATKERSLLDSQFRKNEQELLKPLVALKQQQEAELKDAQKRLTQQKTQYQHDRENELKGKGANTDAIKQHETQKHEIEVLLAQIEKQRSQVFAYQKDKTELFDKEETFRQEKKQLETQQENLQHKYAERKERLNHQLQEHTAHKEQLQASIKEKEDGLKQYDSITNTEHLLSPEWQQDDKKTTTHKSCQILIAELRGAHTDHQRKTEELKHNIQKFNSYFTPDNTFHFNTTPNYDADYIQIAQNLQEFIDQDKIEQYRSRTNEQYHNILQRVSKEVGYIMNYQSDIDIIIRDINRDFIEKNFAGVIKSIELRQEPSDDVLMRLLNSIRLFIEENAMNLGETNLFSDDNKDDINRKVVDYLQRFMQQLQKEHNRTRITLQDTFNLQFRVRENDNSTGWVSRINNVGSDGTDILVKAMINIMLINVFKNKASKRTNKDFIIHCMMDEIGKLHPNNVQGILQFANSRNIYLINSSPITNNAYDYKYIYMLAKDDKSNTIVTRLLTNLQ